MPAAPPLGSGRTAPRPASDLIEELRRGGPAVVALSGGVDSSVVAALLQAALGSAARAVTLSGPAITEEEVDRAVAVARQIGIRHDRVAVDPLASEAYVSNPPNRCYFCRQVEAGAIRSWAGAGFRFLDGVHADDLGDDRPGLRALDAAGFEHPLLRAGWGKAEVRAHARSVGLLTADQPSDACLASRIRHGLPVTADLLGRIGRAERAVRAAGFRRVRVRVETDGARIEVDPDEVGRLAEGPLLSEVRAALAREGFAEVVVDPNGYRSRSNA